MVGTVAITCEGIIDGTGTPLEIDKAVVIEGQRIARICSRSEAPVAADEVLDFPGSFLVPGLIDMHVHLMMPGNGTPIEEAIEREDNGTLLLLALKNAQTAMAAGITTVRDVGGKDRLIIELRNAINKGIVSGPRVASSGRPLTITGGHCHLFGGEADGEDGVRYLVRQVIKEGADLIKVYACGGDTRGTLYWKPSYSAEELKVIVAEAHKLERRVTAHCLCSQAAQNALDAGVDEIQHASWPTAPGAWVHNPELERRVAQSGVYVCPTLSIRWYNVLAHGGPEKGAAFMPKHLYACETFAHLVSLRVPLVAGTDAGWSYTPFDALPTALKLATEYGMTPLQAIASATGVAARALGWQEWLGTVKKGMMADLLLVSGDPSQDIGALRRVVAVFKDGQIVARRQ